MKTTKFLLSITLISCFATLQLTSALAAPPPLPSGFYGTVTMNGEDVAEGMTLEARIDGVLYASEEVFLHKSNSVYSIDVPADSPYTPEIETGVAGNEINFTFGGLPADQTGLWSTGSNIELDLTTTALEIEQEIALSNTTLNEDPQVGSEVGVLSVEEDDPEAEVTYHLVPGEGDTDNDLFTIDGDRLVTAEPLTRETWIDFSVRIRAVVQGGESVTYSERIFIISLLIPSPPDLQTFLPLILN